MNLIPEYIINYYLEQIRLVVKMSIINDTSVEKTNNYIHDIFGDIYIKDFKIKKEALALFEKDKSFDIKIGFNIGSAELKKPLVMILMPSEEESIRIIGEVDQTERETNTVLEKNELERVKYFKTRYHLMIIHQNADVVVSVYRVLQSMFMLYSDEMIQSGFIDLTIGGADLIPEKNVDVPVHLYNRVLMLDFSYKNTLPYRVFETNAGILYSEGVPSLEIIEEGSENDEEVPEQVVLVSPDDNSIDVIFDNVDLEWGIINGDNITYHLQISTDPGIGSNPIFDQDGIKYTKFTVPNGILSSSIQYYWRVRAKNFSGYGVWSSVRCFTIQENSELPIAPVLVSPLGTIETNEIVDFVWEVGFRAESYDFQISSNENFTALLVDVNLTRTTFEYTFSSNGVYYWRVRSRNRYGVSEWVV